MSTVGHGFRPGERISELPLREFTVADIWDTIEMRGVLIRLV